MRALAVAALLALFLAPAALAKGRSPLHSPLGDAPSLTKAKATAIFLAEHKVLKWVDRYPSASRVTDADYDKATRSWTVKVWSGKAWEMARGYSGAFGGKLINTTWIWLSFCAVFFFGLANLRRPLSLRNLDLLVLLSLSVSLWYFNKGDIFTSVPLAYPPLLYLLARAIWIAARPRAAAFRPVWPVWLLAAAAVFLLGFRIGINVEAPRSVIDVGYSGVIGADRISSGQSPYGHMPIEDSLKPCGPADSSGEIRERIQTNGRCESA